MRSLWDYIREEGEACTTPLNTLGAGNPHCPTETMPGSEPLPAKKRKKKSLKESHCW